MTDADIIRIAQESELWDAIGSIARVYGTINPAIIDFAQRIRSAAIAECAAVCDARVMAIDNGGNEYRRPADAESCDPPASCPHPPRTTSGPRGRRPDTHSRRRAS